MKNLSIQEGQVSRNFTAEKLAIDFKDGSGVSYWVSEDAKKRGPQYAFDNGVYKAYNDGLYAYSSFDVHVFNAADGAVIRDRFGGEYFFHTGNDGKIRAMSLPTSIQIKTAPTKLVYEKGETIRFNGIAVEPLAKDIVWQSYAYPDGVVPINELFFPIVRAEEETQIPVCWIRPVDGKQLETYFTITINQPAPEEPEEPEPEEETEGGGE